MKIHKDFEIRELIADLQKKPEKHLALDVDQKADILEYIQNEIFKQTKEAFEIIDLNPNYSYPAGVTDKLEYWLNRSLSHLLYIQKLIQQQPPAKEPETKDKPPKQPPKLIFRNDADRWKVFELLEPYFVGQSKLLSMALVNELQTDPLIFSGSAKMIIEFFKRLEYNQVFINQNNKPIKNWLYERIKYIDKGNPKALNLETIDQYFNKSTGNIAISKRIGNEVYNYLNKSQRKDLKTND